MASETTADGKENIFHTLDLDEFGLHKVPREERTRVKQDVADFLEEEILRNVATGKSPVQGEGRFRRLDKDYAKEQKGGVRTSNLELEGDLLTDFIIKRTTGSKLKIGHINSSETPKSDGHNQLSDKAKQWAKKAGFPKRRYIPDDAQVFKKSIRDGIEAIIDANVVVEREADSDVEEFEISESPEIAVEGVGPQIGDESSISFDNLFSDESITAFLNSALTRAGRK